MLLRKLTLLSFLLILTVGCAGEHYRVLQLDESIKSKDWESAFLNYSLLIEYTDEPLEEQATQKVKQYPSIIAAGTAYFDKANLRSEVQSKRVTALDLEDHAKAICRISSPSDCQRANENVKEAKTWFKQQIYVTKPAYQALSKAQQDALQTSYEVVVLTEEQIGVVTERQTQDMSSAGSVAGSTLGSSVASAIYIDNAVSNTSYNMWTDLGVGVLGGLLGASGNKAPVRQFSITYAVKTLDGNLRKVTVTQGSPIGEPVGSCFNLLTKVGVDSRFCQMTPALIQNTYLK